jgi:hypothetical protein
VLELSVVVLFGRPMVKSIAQTDGEFFNVRPEVVHGRGRQAIAGILRGSVLGPWIVLQGFTLGSQLAFRGLTVKVSKVPTH